MNAFNSLPPVLVLLRPQQQWQRIEDVWGMERKMWWGGAPSPPAYALVLVLVLVVVLILLLLPVVMY